MSVATNTGNQELDSLGKQINRLEQDPNATPEYDKALEHEFAAVVAQVLGSGGGQAGGSSGGADPATMPPASSHGSSGGTDGAPAAAVSPSETAAYNKLEADIKGGADNSTILTDAAQLAIAAGANGDVGLAAIARNIGNSIGNSTYSQSASLSLLDNTAPGTPGAAQPPQGPTLPDATGSAYRKLESDIENGADQKTVQADAAQVKSLAEKDGNTYLASTADAILTSINNNTYNPYNSEVALMSNGTTPASAPPSEMAAYNKLEVDIKSGFTGSSLVQVDAAQLALAAGAHGDVGLAAIARNIGNSIGNSTYSPSASLSLLDNTAPGTPGAAQPPQGPTLPDATGSAYRKLESDIENGADQKTVQADAEQLKSLAEKGGNTDLASAAGAILDTISNGNYRPLTAEGLMMNAGATS